MFTSDEAYSIQYLLLWKKTNATHFSVLTPPLEDFIFYSHVFEGAQQAKTLLIFPFPAGRQR
jgi:hypothetical protein